MTKCPFCHFENEDGSLFCEQCKSDLSPVTPEPVLAGPEPVPVGAIPVEAIPAGALSSGMPEAAPVVLEAIPVAAEAAGVPAAEVVSVAAEPAAPEPAPALKAVAAVAENLVPAAEPPRGAPPPAPEPAPASRPDAAAPDALPAEAQPRLLVLRGQKRNVEYPLYDGLNFIGRADEKPVDIDLEDQEPPDRVWCSRQHCCISFELGKLEIEDLNSANGTFVNRQRIYPGQKRHLQVNDIIQIGNVQLRVIV